MDDATNTELPSEPASASELRRLFNASRYYDRVVSGELSEVVISSSTPSPRSQQPAGTVSQIVDYYDGADVVARVHQFLRADGSLGASGHPDPKVVVYDSVRYVLDPSL